jgi:hypothetical protein
MELKKRGRGIMYRPKKSILDHAIAVFIGVAVLVLVGTIAFGIFITQGGGQSFDNLKGGNSDSPLKIKR